MWPLIRSSRVFAAACIAWALSACAPSRHSGSDPLPERNAAAADSVADLAPFHGDSAFDRSGYGAAPIPIWSPLTPPELRALTARDLAAAGNAHALLDLAILASGDTRTDSGYASIRARFDAFVAKEAKVLARLKGARAKGARLLIDMHAHFFLPGLSDARGIRPGYAWEQSALTGIFADRKFNCISSAILYVTLARALGMDAEGVALPNHAFAQVNLPDGSKAEVETTTPEGFGIRHDKAFFARHGSGWFTARGLPASTFADYQARRILPPHRFIAFNMWNQHAMAEGRSLQDRHRLAEARAWLDPDDALAMHNLLAVYGGEGGYLTRAKDWRSMERLGRLIMPAMPGLRRRWDAEKELTLYVAWMPWYYASALRGLGRGDEAFAWIDSSLAWIKPDHHQAADLAGNDYGLVIGITQDMAQAKRFAAAEKILLAYIGRADQPGKAVDFPGHMAWFYGTWSGEAWKREDWNAVAARLEKGLAYADESRARPMRDNLAAAYYNQAIAFLNQGRRDKATAKLRACLDRLPDAKLCKERLQDLRFGKS